MQERIELKVDIDVEWPTTEVDGRWFTTGTAWTKGETSVIEIWNEKFTHCVVEVFASAEDLDRLNQKSWYNE